MIELLGKTAFVTGASEGVGLEIAKAFFDRGAKVYLASKNSEQLTNVCNKMDTSLTRAIPVPLEHCGSRSEDDGQTVQWGVSEVPRQVPAAQ